MEIAVNAKVIAAALLFAGKKDTRNYLNGVLLERNAHNTLLVSTDGKRLACFKIECPPEKDVQTFSVVIPYDLLAKVNPKGDYLVRIIVGPQKEKSYSRSLTIVQGNTTLNGESVNEKYFDFKRAIPDKVSGEVAQYNPVYLNDFAKARAILLGRREEPFVKIGYNGRNAALVDIGVFNFIGVLMPLSDTQGPTELPKWVKE